MNKIFRKFRVFSACLLTAFSLLQLATPALVSAAEIKDESSAAAVCRTLPGGTASTSVGYCAFTAPGATSPCKVSGSGSSPVFGETCQTFNLADMVGQDDDELRRTATTTGGGPTQATEGSGTTTDTGSPTINRLLQTTIDFVSGIIGLVVVLSIIFAGFQYLTARDNPQQVRQAKDRIFMSVIALLLFAFAFGFLQWLVPGGIFD